MLNIQNYFVNLNKHLRMNTHAILNCEYIWYQLWATTYIAWKLITNSIEIDCSIFCNCIKHLYMNITKKYLKLSHFREKFHILWWIVENFCLVIVNAICIVQYKINFKPMSINLQNNERVNVNDVDSNLTYFQQFCWGIELHVKNCLMNIRMKLA